MPASTHTEKRRGIELASRVDVSLNSDSGYYEHSGLEPSSFSHLDAAAAFSATPHSVGFIGALIGDVPAADHQ
jgi:hypothetical protein